MSVPGLSYACTFAVRRSSYQTFQVHPAASQKLLQSPMECLFFTAHIDLLVLVTVEFLLSSLTRPFPQSELLPSKGSLLAFFFFSFSCLHPCLSITSVPGAPGNQKRALGPWNWIYRQLGASMWVLGMEPRSSGRAANAFHCLALSSPRVLALAGGLLSF